MKKQTQAGFVHVANSFVFACAHTHLHSRASSKHAAFRLECMSNGADNFSDGCSAAKG